MAIKLIVKKTESNGTVSVKEIILNDEFSTIGNVDSSTLFLDDVQISNEQAVILVEENRAILINRADGTYFNETSIPKETRCEITNGDEIQFGNHTVSFLNVNYKPKNSIFIPATNGNAVVSEFSAEVPENQTVVSEINSGESGHSPKPTKSFADILSSIRKEEDRFYFQLKNGNNDKKLAIEKDEIILGWDLTGKILSDDPNVVVMPRAVIKKDWSGVMAYPQGKDFVWVNGEAIASASRLHDGDKLTFLSSFSSAPQNDTSIVFCEPAALVEINSILPQELPSVAPDRTDWDDEKQFESGSVAGLPIEQKIAAKKAKRVKRKWFGYFSFGEVFLMILVTLGVGALVFLILEYW
jgi:pSer/pThr/pTyr-binding forkhead associated (FHA) protein